MKKKATHRGFRENKREGGILTEDSTGMTELSADLKETRRRGVLGNGDG
jgi:hypothetical protein